MNIRKIHSETDIRNYIIDCYNRSDNKCSAGFFCGKCLSRIFSSDIILNVSNIYILDIEKENKNKYIFKQFKKGLFKGLIQKEKRKNIVIKQYLK